MASRGLEIASVLQLAGPQAGEQSEANKGLHATRERLPGAGRRLIAAPFEAAAHAHAWNTKQREQHHGRLESHE